MVRQLAGNLHQKEDSCPAKRQSTGHFVSFGSFVRPNANPPDVLSFSAIESTKIRKIHRSGRVYTKATVANEL